MADAAYNLSDAAASIAPTVTSLYALRRGLVALVDHHRAGTDEAAWGAALDALWDLDRRILDKAPKSLADLRCQAAVVRANLTDDLAENEPLTARLLAHLTAA